MQCVVILFPFEVSNLKPTTVPYGGPRHSVFDDEKIETGGVRFRVQLLHKSILTPETNCYKTSSSVACAHNCFSQSLLSIHRRKETQANKTSKKQSLHTNHHLTWNSVKECMSPICRMQIQLVTALISTPSANKCRVL